MFDYLPKSIRAVRDRCWSAETPGGLLRCLPHLFKAVQKDRETAPQIAKLNAQLKSCCENEMRNRERAIEWMRSCLKCLKSSPYANHPVCVPDLMIAKDLIVHRKLEKNPSAIFSELTLKLFGVTEEKPYNPL